MGDIANNDKKFILLIDILGYKAMSKKSSIEDLLNKIGSLITAASDAGEFVGGVKSYVYADTIVFIPLEQKYNTLAELIQIARLVLFWSNYVAICGGEYIPIRGAIGYGEVRVVGPALTTKNIGIGNSRARVANNVQMLIGNGLLDAYEAEQQLELMGVILSDTVASVEAVQKFSDGVIKGDLIKYNCPLKINKKNEKKNVAKKVKLLVNQLDMANIDAGIAKMQERAILHTGDVQNKYKNTVDFLHYSGSLIKKEFALMTAQSNQ